MPVQGAQGAPDECPWCASKDTIGHPSTASSEAGTAAAESSADAALRTAMKARSLDGLVDAIHGNADGATPAALGEARALRDDLREQKKLDALSEAR